MPIRIIYLTIICFLSSCAGSQTDKNTEIVEKWRGTQLIIPDSIVDVVSGMKIDMNNAKFTILTYVDSAGCTDCAIRIPWWDNLKQALDTIPDVDVDIIMVVNSRNKRDIVSLLKRHSYKYPVYLDINDTINDLNDFPNNPMFQTFLLDKSKRVIAIGNPVYFPSLYDLYFSIITGEQTVAAKTDMTVKIENNLENPICLNVGEDFTHEFSLSNLGNDTVFISNVTSSCDCATASLSQNFIAPKASIKAMVQIKGDSSTGSFVRIVNVNYEDFDSPSVLRILGDVEVACVQ